MYLKAIELSPWNLNYRNNLADIYYKNKEYGNAIENYSDILKLNQNYLLPYSSLSHSYRCLGKLKDARE